jgi:hypothetical protein
MPKSGEQMRKEIILLFVFLLLFIVCGCREKKFKEVDKKRTEERTRRIKYINVYNVNYNSVKKGEFYNVIVDFYANNVSEKKVYWFQVLVNIYSKGKLTHSVLYTPNYYEKKGTNVKYYRILAQGQTGKFRIVLASSYKIKEPPDLVRLEVFDVGDNIDIFKKIRVNPDKYFIPYSPGD